MFPCLARKLIAVKGEDGQVHKTATASVVPLSFFVVKRGRQGSGARLSWVGPTTLIISMLRDMANQGLFLSPMIRRTVPYRMYDVQSYHVYGRV